LLLAGCGTATTSSGSSSTAATTKARVCQQLASVNQSLTQLSQIGDSTTVGEVKVIQQKVTVALNALAKLPVGGGTTLSDLQAANNELAAMINGQPDSATVGQVGPRLQAIKGKVSKAQTATTKLTTLLKC
jgi:hypothetical protein